MSNAPLPYERAANFVSYEATYPTRPKRGIDLDNEFNSVGVALNATMARLAEIQRDDGFLANGSVHPQSLTSETFVLLGSDFSPRGSWMTDTAYNPADLVERAGLNYLSTITHVSGDFDVDLASGKWQAFGGYPTAAQVVFAPAGSIASVSVQQAIQELDGDVQGKQPANDNLIALAALSPVADRLPYWTSGSDMALATITSFARTLLDDANAAAARTTLELVTGVSAGNIVALDGSAKLPAVDGSQLTGIVAPDASITDAKLAATLNLSAKTLTLPPANTPALVKYFESAQQTITFAGALTIAHGLAVKPKLLYAVLQCVTTEFNYTVGDEVAINVSVGTEASLDCGLSLVPDATNIAVRFGGNGLSVINKTNGNHGQITAANWRLVVRAFA